MHDAGRETSSRHKVYRHVRDGIISRKLRPGDMLYERELAQALGVSRTPVREALQSLQDDGWLTVIPRRGTVVRPLSRVEIEEVLQLRSIIAAASLMLSAGRVGPQDLAYLGTFIKLQEEAAKRGDSLKFMDADMDFHLALVRLAGNRRLTAITEDLLGHFKRIGSEALEAGRDFEVPIAAHKAILAAVANGETEKARDLMVDHIGQTRDLLVCKDSKGEPAAC